MPDLVVIVPSRGRPEAAVALVQHFADTCTGGTRLLFAIDESDPTAERYAEATGVLPPGHRVIVNVLYCPSTSMVEALNAAAGSAAWYGGEYAIGFMGDDHRPRTYGWDSAYLAALRELGTGIVYGNDLLQGERLPTQCAMTADIVRALGYMAPPMLRHMYVDNFWMDLGSAAGCLRYLPDVIVEHVHPLGGKVAWDEGHKRVNAAAVYSADEQAYQQFVGEQMPDAVASVRQLCGRPATPANLPATDRPTEAPPADVHEWQLFEAGTVPEYTRPEWYANREHAPHLEQAGHRDRLMATASLVAWAATGGLRTVVDLGAGDGGLLSLLGPALTGWGYDLQPTNLQAAKDRGVDVRYGDVVDGDVEWGQIAVCTEMLEHLVDPHAFVRRIAAHAQILVCSSPWGERPGAAYEFHTWAWDLAGYRTLVERSGFAVLRQQRVHGFQLILAARP
jgi:hypothetical protein